MDEKSTETVTLCEGKFTRFVRRGTWEYAIRLHASGVVGIVAVTPEGKLLLVEQYRPPLDQRAIELPAGLVGDTPQDKDEALATAALRELEEETGYTAERMVFLTEGPPSSGITNEIIAIFLAQGVRRVGPGGGDASENLIIHEVPLAEVPTFLEARRRQGVQVDLRIYMALYYLEHPELSAEK
ncbi:MAG: NUDIX hydrolase [Armatimonadota bacterium]